MEIRYTTYHYPASLRCSSRLLRALEGRYDSGYLAMIRWREWLQARDEEATVLPVSLALLVERFAWVFDLGRHVLNERSRDDR